MSRRTATPLRRRGMRVHARACAIGWDARRALHIGCCLCARGALSTRLGRAAEADAVGSSPHRRPTAPRATAAAAL
eukprot:7209370-Prymnesium_polylepis.1